MGADTKIEWADHTFNPWLGCTPISPACAHCYAEAWAARTGQAYLWEGNRRRTTAENWRQPLKWNARLDGTGRRETVFCLSLGDIWDKDANEIWRRDLFDRIEATPNLIWLLLSKRIGNAVKMCERGLPKNAALGATMVNQEEWDRDAPKLDAAKHALGPLFTFASIEPMLGPMDIRQYMPDQVICGGESGPYARPMNSAWPRSLRDQCAAAGVQFFFKQWGEFLPVGQCLPSAGKVNGGTAVMAGRMKLHLAGTSEQCPKYAFAEKGVEFSSTSDGRLSFRVGKKAAGRLLDGVEHNGMPVVARG
jgi:protein gp37